ncbi:unnamed protein product [Brassica rapa]|uniref:Uncharacterized protein n=1 Tax=Brassica campestris TaxID=3711 RepID=A0A8D9D904_BRACM|nr:unnamed protein product [Brassica rapa]CAG7871308.1 unnamed protein product [Brassica rapa]
MFGKTSKLRSYLARPSGARVASGRFANTETGVSLSFSLSLVRLISFFSRSLSTPKAPNRKRRR